MAYWIFVEPYGYNGCIEVTVLMSPWEGGLDKLEEPNTKRPTTNVGLFYVWLKNIGRPCDEYPTTS